MDNPMAFQRQKGMPYTACLIRLVPHLRTLVNPRDSLRQNVLYPLIVEAQR